MPVSNDNNMQFTEFPSQSHAKHGISLHSDNEAKFLNAPSKKKEFHMGSIADFKIALRASEECFQAKTGAE